MDQKYKNSPNPNSKYKGKRQERHLNISALRKKCLVLYTLIYDLYTLCENSDILKMSILKYRNLKLYI